MRKNLHFSALAFAALAFAGCSQEDVVSETHSADKAVEFGTYLGRDAQMRASVATVDNLKKTVAEGGGFGVYAYHTTGDFDPATPAEPNFMNNQLVTFNSTSNKWEYSPVKYWPNNEGDKLSFLAYAPYSNAGSTDAGNGEVVFEVANAVADQKDLLYTAPDANLNLTKQAIEENVTFNFLHALSRIGFSVQGAVDLTTAGGTLAEGTTIKVEKVILSGQKIEGAATPTTGAFLPKGTLDLTSGVWTLDNTQTKQSYTLTTDNFVGGQAVELSGDQSNSTPLNNNESFLMVLPQTFTEAAPLYVYVQYTVTTTDNKLGTAKESKITNYISKTAQIDFLPGKAYTLKLVLGMTSVKLAAEVQGWDETLDEIPVDLPLNTTTTPQTPAGE